MKVIELMKCIIKVIEVRPKATFVDIFKDMYKKTDL